jgi:hypothetical protein
MNVISDLRRLGPEGRFRVWTASILLVLSFPMTACHASMAILACGLEATPFVLFSGFGLAIGSVCALVLLDCLREARELAAESDVRSVLES